MTYKCTRYYTVLVFLFLGWLSQLDAQSTATIVLSQDTVQVGEAFSAKLQYTSSNDIQLKGIDISGLFNPETLYNVFTADDTTKKEVLPDFEILSLGAWDGYFDQHFVNNNSINWQSNADGRRKMFSNEVRIIFWDPGVYVLNAGNIIPVDSTDQERILSMEGSMLFVEVPPMFTDTTQAVQLRPIKSIIREARNWTDYYALYGLILFFILAGAALFFYKKQSSKQVLIEEEVYIPPPHELALDQLTILGQQELWQKGEIKKYQSSLTRIIREYLENRYQINALEMTTDQISNALKKSSFDFSYESKLKRILSMADLIKFAKAKPPADIHQQFFNTAKQFIHDTKQLEVIPSDEEE